MAVSEGYQHPMLLYPKLTCADHRDIVRRVHVHHAIVFLGFRPGPLLPISQLSVALLSVFSVTLVSTTHGFVPPRLLRQLVASVWPYEGNGSTALSL